MPEPTPRRACPERIEPMTPHVPPPGTPDSPITDDILLAELGLAREHGLNNPNYPLPNLLAVARILSAKPTDAEQIEDAITQAIGCLGGDDAKALMALMGFTDDTRGRRVRPRREKAAELIGHITYEGFRTRHERALLRAVAGHLSSLARERRMADTIKTASATPEVSASSLRSSDADAGATPETDEEALPDGHDGSTETAPPHLAGRRRPPPPRRLLAALGACLVAGAALLVAVLSSGSITPRHCGPTGLQFISQVAVPDDPEKPSNLFVYAPRQVSNEEGWASYSLSWKGGAKETFHANETRLLALTYHNELNEPVTHLLARVGLSEGAVLQPNSVCIYENPAHIGKASPGNALVHAGLRLPTVPPYSPVDITFEIKLPPSPNQHEAEAYGAIGYPSEVSGLDLHDATATNSLTVPLTK
jgi:hypothetical protein